VSPWASVPKRKAVGLLRSRELRSSLLSFLEFFALCEWREELGGGLGVVAMSWKPCFFSSSRQVVVL